jgi:membrane protein DedA with SNARE-associated domain
LVGAVLFVIVYLSLGYFAGSLFDNISDSYGIGESFTVVMTLLSIFTIIIGIYKYKKKEKHKSD